jgi:Putative beta-barrel porin 2
MAQVVDTGLSAFAGATWSDNLGRGSGSPESGAYLDVGVVGHVGRDEGRLTGQFGTNLSYREYLDNQYDSEVVGRLSGDARYLVVPEWFQWVASDDFGQLRANATSPEGPNNRENFNYFQTGPDFMFPLGARTFLNVSGRWGTVNYETRDFDNNRLTGSVGLGHHLSETSQVSLNASYTQLEYVDSPPNTNYDFSSVYLSYSIQGARTRLSADGGYTEVKLDDSPLVAEKNRKANGLLAHLSITRDISPRSTLDLDLGTKFADAADLFRLDNINHFPDNNNDNGDALGSADPIKTDYAYLTWALNHEPTTYRLRGSWRQEAHEVDTTQDRDRYTVEFVVTRRANERLHLSGNVYYRKEDFSEIDTVTDDWGVALGAQWFFSQAFSMRGSISHREGSGDNSGRDYAENRISVRVYYSFRR